MSSVSSSFDFDWVVPGHARSLKGGCEWGLGLNVSGTGSWGRSWDWVKCIAAQGLRIVSTSRVSLRLHEPRLWPRIFRSGAKLWTKSSVSALPRCNGSPSKAPKIRKPIEAV